MTKKRGGRTPFCTMYQSADTNIKGYRQTQKWVLSMHVLTGCANDQKIWGPCSHHSMKLRVPTSKITKNATFWSVDTIGTISCST